MKTILFAALSAVAFCATAADKPRDSGAHQRYLDERAKCDGPKVEDKKACLREAGAAQDEARKGTLGKENTEFEKNAVARCGYHKIAEDRAYCERRMRGEGTVSGSVEGGGLLRELTVIVPAEESGAPTR